jgi:signal transduction histidine kinase
MEDPAVAREFLEKIERNARNLGHLVSDLLVLSRVEAGGIQVEPDPFPAFTVVGEAAAACADKARDKSLELRVVPGPRDALIRGDRDLLVRALVNLLDNAIQYTKPGGRVDVTMTLAGSRVEVTVSDTGIGIPPNELTRIFERFYRVDKARSRALGGTGLGLAIVKHVAERHGGSIRVVSEETRGSSFTLSLPSAA